MRGLIVYASKYGSTRQYAEWVRDETGFDLVEAKHAPADFGPFDVVVVGASVLAGRVTLAKWIREHWPALRGKAVYLLLVHINMDPQATASVVPQSLPEEIARAIAVFPVGGRYAPQRMSWFDRTLVTMLAKLEKRPEVKRELLEERDFVRKEELQGLLAAIRERRSMR